ncbi:alpha/beta fold hydrolase [Paenibacillus thalictri]|uniref:Alpha/beta fold hydrolase n=1 Tax=Paenibacillus thalictri TaxID=2527873 RepID=A0A4Q9DMA2_9BACL|nr:alpha/beta hydrolase [Paenibacillus thalictri]TBL75748.1 alpha/beta fold hydrolase [Paenibacillus thalictri]
MPTFISNGTELFYEQEGAGFPLVMLHGLMGSSMTLKHEMGHFKAHFRVTALDSRGHGKSHKPPHYTLEDHVQDVIALLDFLGIEAAYLLGVSMGSYIAQGVAIAIPERIKKLVLIVPKSNGKTSSMQQLFERHADEMKDLTTEQKFSHVFNYMFHNDAAVQNAMSEWQQEHAMLTDPKEQAAANKALEGFDYRTDLKKIRARTLVISGKFDGLNPPERGKEIAALIPNSTFAEFEVSGHAPSIEEPERFMAEVLNFLI